MEVWRCICQLQCRLCSSNLQMTRTYVAVSVWSIWSRKKLFWRLEVHAGMLQEEGLCMYEIKSVSVRCQWSIPSLPFALHGFLCYGEGNRAPGSSIFKYVLLLFFDIEPNIKVLGSDFGADFFYQQQCLLQLLTAITTTMVRLL